MLAPLPGITKGLCPVLGGNPPGVPGLPPPLCHLSLPPALRDPPGSHAFLYRRLRSDGFLGVLPSEHLVITEVLRGAEGQAGLPGYWLLHP